MREAVGQRITAAAFLQLPETNTPCELLNGAVITMPSPATDHQRAVLRAATAVGQMMSGGEVFIAPLDVVLDDYHVVQPDVIWVAPDSACRIEDRRLVGAPDFILEGLSPGSVHQDKRVKFRLYERCGVREYWMLDLAERLVEVWSLREGHFTLVDVYSADETFASPLLGPVAVETLLPR